MAPPTRRPGPTTCLDHRTPVTGPSQTASRIGACGSPARPSRPCPIPPRPCPAAPRRSRFPSVISSMAQSSLRRIPTAARSPRSAMGCFWGAEKVFWEMPGVIVDGRRLRRRLHAEPDVRGGLLGQDRPRRGRPGRVRPEGRQLRAAPEGVLGEPRSDPGHAPGQRHRHPVPVGDLHPDDEQRRIAEASRDAYQRAPDGRRVRHDHDRDRAAPARSTSPRTTTSSTSPRIRGGYCPNHSTGVKLPGRPRRPDRGIADRDARLNLEPS